MKRRSVEGLSESLFLFSVVNSDNSLDQVFAQFVAQPFASVGDGGSKRVVLVLLGGGAPSLGREWMCGLTVGQLQSYNHHARTAVYQWGDRVVTVMSGENWFPRGVDIPSAIYEFELALSAVRRSFGFSFLASPTLTGLHCLESKIPFGVWSCQDEAFHSLLHRHTTQSRNEFLGQQKINEFWYYDRRFAYAADVVLDMPIGEPSVAEPVWVPYQPAFYQVRFSVPNGFQHVGLLPVLAEGGWQWPSDGEHSTFVAEPELRVAIDAGWRVEVLARWEFDSGRPFEKSVKTLVQLFESFKRAGYDIAAGIIRRLVLQAIGAMYARVFEREQIVGESELLERNDEAVLTAEAQGDGRYSLRDRSERRDSRFYAPIWTAYTWSRARAALAKAMLGIPRERLLGCHVDAIYTTGEVLTLPDNGRVGQFRLKGKLEELNQTPVSSLSGLQRLKKLTGGE